MCFLHVCALAPDAQFWSHLLKEVDRQISQWVCSILPGFLHRPLVYRLKLQCCPLATTSLERAMKELGDRKDGSKGYVQSQHLPHTKFYLLSAFDNLEQKRCLNRLGRLGALGEEACTGWLFITRGHQQVAHRSGLWVFYVAHAVFV